MHCYEIRLNGEHVCLAGIEGEGVPTAIIDDVISKSNALHLTVGAVGRESRLTARALPYLIASTIFPN
jgi:hypothetical protein